MKIGPRLTVRVDPLNKATNTSYSILFTNQVIRLETLGETF